MASIVVAQMRLVEKHLNSLLGLFECVLILTENGTRYELSKAGTTFSLKKISPNSGGFLQPGEERKFEAWRLALDPVDRIRIRVIGDKIHETGPLKEVAIPFA